MKEVRGCQEVLVTSAVVGLAAGVVLAEAVGAVRALVAGVAALAVGVLFVVFA